MNGELSRWMPSILSVVIIAGGGLVTAGWMQNETQNMRKELMRVSSEITEMRGKREIDRELLVEIKTSLEYIKRVLLKDEQGGNSK